ncbi:MAG: CoA transferase [Candidatus Poribacteria bacterium]|nr:CoA transferase [Candidatus Poribacteria bacterium]
MDTALETQPPLTGIRVVDFGHYIAGPLVGMLLADQGAEVIKIDRPGEPDFDTPANATFNRGKQKLQLDLKTPEGLKTAKNLIQSADVLIENFRPGVMTRLGLGHNELTKSNPRLVYLSLPGFASTDSEKCTIRAFEGVVGSASGLYWDLHPARRRLVGAPPVYTPIPMGSAYGAIHGALAVVLALYAREENGCGEVIEVPLAGAAMSAMSGMILHVEKPPATFRGRSSKASFVAQLRDERAHVEKMSEDKRQAYWREASDLGTPFLTTYPTDDDNWVHLHTAGNGRLTIQLFKALGIYESLIRDGMVDAPCYENLELTNNVQNPGGLSQEWNYIIRERMTTAFLTKPAACWEQAMRTAGIPFTVHRTAQEWLHAPEPEAAALTVTIDDPEHGMMRQFGVQTSLSKTPDECLQPRPARRFPGQVDKNSADLTHQSDVEGLEPTKTPKKQILDGLKVLDLSTVLAGPTSARTLAEYGADVIKIDPPSPYFGPGTMCWSAMEVSQGKRSIILDIKSDDGLKIFHRLVKTADIVVHNFSPGVPERVGIDYPSLRLHNPDIICVHLTAFNGPRPGPWGNRKGFDPVLQAATGIMHRFGGKDQRPMLHGWASCVDYLTGYSASFGAALALFKRKRSGKGDLAMTSLAQGAQLVQAPLMYATKAHRSGGEPQGQEATGEHALYRIYRANDAWLFLAGRKSDQSKLKQIPALADFPVSDASNEEQAQFLEEAIQTQTVDYWIEIFQEADLGCHRVDCLEDIRDAYLHQVNSDSSASEWDDGRSISVIRMMDHPIGNPVDTPAPLYARLKNASIRIGNPIPKLGSDTREVLKEIGYPDEQIEEWISEGVIKDQLHDKYLPG